MHAYFDVSVSFSVFTFLWWACRYEQVASLLTGVTAALVIKNLANPDLLSWRTPVRDFLLTVDEDFYFNDTLRSQRVNLRDLFGHRSVNLLARKMVDFYLVIFAT